MKIQEGVSNLRFYGRRDKVMHSDDPTTGPADVKEWLEHFRKPAIEKDYEWLAERQLFCTYKDGKRYRCIGCSRMGDAWLTKHFERTFGYDLRIDIADCTDWEVVSSVQVTGDQLTVIDCLENNVVLKPNQQHVSYAQTAGKGVDSNG